MMKCQTWRAAKLFAALAAGGIALPLHAQATELVFAGGLNLSSIRTAQQQSFAAYSGMAGGLGLDMNLSEQLYVETDVLFIQRRFAAASTLPTLTIPVLGKYESKYFMLGAGLYFANLMGISADDGTPATLDTFKTADIGWIATAGTKLYLTKTMNGFVDLRVSRGFINAYANPNSTDPFFYWSQFQFFVGVRIRMKTRR